MLSEVFEAKFATLKTLVPIHIGSVEQKLTPFEYIVKDGYVYHVSEEKLSKLLAKLNLIDAFVTEVEIQGHRFRIMDFFKRQKVEVGPELILGLTGGRRAKITGNHLDMQDYKPFVRDGNGKIYIPGTSIKGVIRTAILYKALKDLKEKDPEAFKQRIEDRILQRIEDGKNKKNMFAWGNQEWFESFFLEDNRDFGPHTDWLRLLHVSDAYPNESFETKTIPLNVLKKEKDSYNLKKEDGGKNTTIWVETVPEGVSFNFLITWDRRLLDKFKRFNPDIILPQSLDAVFECLKVWKDGVIQEEITFFGQTQLAKWYKDQAQNLGLRIGFGSGILATTIFPLLSQSVRKAVRNYAGLNRGDEIAPKSRRIWLKDNRAYPLGWVSLSMRPYEKGQEIFATEPSSTIETIEPDIASTESYQLKESPEEVASTQTKPEQISWPNAYVTFNPGKRTLLASHENKKAELKLGDDLSIVPEKFHRKLFVKRSAITATVIVEPLGNAFKIVRIEEN